MRFGVHTGLQHTTVDELRSVWTRVEALPYDWISVWDHFDPADRDDPHGVNLDAVAMHTALAMHTTRVRCGNLVYCTGYRHPAVLANAAATMDHLSGGRITMGLGAGWHADECAAYGLPLEPPGVRLRRLDEAIQVIRLLLTEEVADFDGEFYSLRGARAEPKPVQERLPLLVGGGGKKVTLRIAAQHADAWNLAFAPPDVYAKRARQLEEHCEAVGRDPATIEKTVNVLLDWDGTTLIERFTPTSLELFRPSVLTGSTAQVVDQVAAFLAAGAQHLNLALRAPFDVESIERFADEVVPAFG
jgi:F420-dependent oxidoreductase-like protein